MKLYLYPEFRGKDEGDGGVRRVVEVQRKLLQPKVGVTFVDDPADADVIASHIMLADSIVRRFPDKPIVAHCHGLYWAEYEWDEWAYKANDAVMDLIRTADIVTAPSEWVAQTIRRHTSRDVRVVYHGVNLREWQMPAESGDYVLWNKTRVDPVCDSAPVDMLARAMPEQRFVTTFGSKLPNVEVVGKLSYEAGKTLVQRAAVYLATSRETFGIGTLEAMACGVPVVGYNFGAQPEIVTHGVDGWLVEPGDIDGLVEGVRWARANLGVIAERARESMKRFSWASAIEAYRDIYKEVHERYSNHDGNPRTTIVVPAYKLAEYLPATIESIKAQTDEDWECIIVDDASPDECGAIADAAAKEDPRFRVIHNETNQYLAEARNIAIREARGRYILPVDADDILTPKAVEMLADALDADRTISVAYGGVFFTAEDGCTPVDYGVPGKRPGHSGWPMPFTPSLQIKGANLLPYSSMFRLDAWRLTGGYRRRLRTAEDADFWTRLASYGFTIKQVTQSDTLVYRNRPGSMSRTENDRRFEYRSWYPWAADESLVLAPVRGNRGVTMLTPRVTVVIPVGPGHAQLVQTAVDSVAAQSYQLWECIVVNDSGERLELPTWVRVIDVDVRDVSAARNAGIAAHAPSSTLYLPLDADDYLQPDALQWMVTAHADTNGNVIYSDFYEDPDEAGAFRPFQLRDWSCEDLLRRGCVHAITALTPIEAWRKVGGYTVGAQWEDWDFQIRCAEAGVCSTHLAYPLFTYRKHTGFRRDYDDQEFERRKAAMIERWGDYFAGRKQLMACGCKAGRIAPQPVVQMAARSAPSSSAVLIQYTGSKAGTIRYRGASKTIYTFAAGDPPKWVLAQDAAGFASRPDFQVVTAEERQASPVLTA